MARIMVQGSIVFQKDLPPKEGFDAQTIVQIADMKSGDRYGAFLDRSHKLVNLPLGTIVGFTGDLTVNTKNGRTNMNLADLVDLVVYKLVAVTGKE